MLAGGGDAAQHIQYELRGEARACGEGVPGDRLEGRRVAQYAVGIRCSGGGIRVQQREHQAQLRRLLG